ncbi:MAG: ammonia-forming cytochrome c nitrite reductase subunit c552 [Azoarcus sp.]|jgi:nitrite reductase (cytochrome c-552)|nr:ammonia-forming cytochrome c nitrite reductase subunit c552 [Azoarcus sp.]
MNKLAEPNKRSSSVGWLLLLVALVVVFVLGLLAAGITEKRAEVASVFNNKKVDIGGAKPTYVLSTEANDKKKVTMPNTNIDSRNDQWGINYQREFETWKKTRETDFKSKHLGNAPEDVLESRPNMVILWAGYAFSRDYSAPRGHWYTLHDMRKSLRTGTPGIPDGVEMQPGTCWTCKSPDVPRMMQELGLGKYYSSKWSELGPDVVNPLGCADCHDPKTMNLSLSRPALVEAFSRLTPREVSKDHTNPTNPITNETLKRIGNDVTKAGANDMRSLVCAQCHVEYYFAEGDNKYLTFPWDNGFSMEDMEKYYDNIGYADWTHALRKAPMLKAQHPDYELAMLGTHGKRGVSCADCHMPYKSEGGVKYTNHQIMSPLKDIAGTCQTCHRDSEEKLRSYVYDNQDRVLEIRNRVEPELAKAHIMTKIALDNGVPVEELKPVHKLLREATWRWDYGVASHGAAFHAPVETARILSAALDKSLLAQIELQKILVARNVAVNLPDISTKAKAQAYIGLNMEKLVAGKAEFMKTVVPAWIKDAADKGKLTDPDLVNQYNNYQYPEPTK